MNDLIRTERKDTASRISVVIPAYNAAPTLPATLDSVLAQSRPAEEVIVVDDGSTDATADILAAYGNRITIVTQPNGGLAAARNAGCAAASGDLIAFLDADDICEPERLAVQEACMASDPAIVLSHSDFSAFGDDIEPRDSYFRDYYSIAGAAGDDLASLLGAQREIRMPADGQSYRFFVGDVYEQLTHGNFVHPPTMMFRRSLFDAAGTFDSEIRNMCDWDWIVRAARFGSFAFIDRPLLAYRLSALQMSGARHRLQASLDIVAVAERIRARDPELHARQRTLFRRELGMYMLDAADALADRHKPAALRMLVRSIAQRTVKPQTARIFVKALLPDFVTSGLRDAKRLLHSGRVADRRADTSLS